MTRYLNEMTSEELAASIRSAEKTDFEALAELCDRAGMAQEWEDATEMTLMPVAYEAGLKLGVNICPEYNPNVTVYAALVQHYGSLSIRQLAMQMKENIDALCACYDDGMVNGGLVEGITWGKALKGARRVVKDEYTGRAELERLRDAEAQEMAFIDSNY